VRSCGRTVLCAKVYFKSALAAVNPLDRDADDAAALQNLDRVMGWSEEQGEGSEQECF